jgi:hypothetical protein
MLKLSIKFSLIHVQWVIWLTWGVFRVNTKKKNNGWFKLKEDLNTTEESTSILKEQEYFT